MPYRIINGAALAVIVASLSAPASAGERKSESWYRSPADHETTICGSLTGNCSIYDRNGRLVGRFLSTPSTDRTSLAAPRVTIERDDGRLGRR